MATTARSAQAETGPASKNRKQAGYRKGSSGNDERPERRAFEGLDPGDQDRRQAGADHEEREGHDLKIAQAAFFVTDQAEAEEDDIAGDQPDEKTAQMSEKQCVGEAGNECQHQRIAFAAKYLQHICGHPLMMRPNSPLPDEAGRSLRRRLFMPARALPGGCVAGRCEGRAGK